jgi:hypothetical protein
MLVSAAAAAAAAGLLRFQQVGEHGIGALLRAPNSSEPLEPLGDIAGGDATWRAWKHVGLHTAQVRHGGCSYL